MDINEFPSHRTFRAMHGDFLLAFIAIVYIKNRISGCKGGALAQDPPISVER
jgi:hypothetical protein